MNRRNFMRNASIIGIGTPLLKNNAFAADPNIETDISLNWIDTQPGAFSYGTTFGLPWKKGTLKKSESILIKHNNVPIPSQSWPLAYWNDGSIKWSATALATPKNFNGKLSAKIGKQNSDNEIQIEETEDYYAINTGVLKVTFPKSGTTIISTLEKDGKVYAQNGKLELQNQEANKTNIYIGKIDGTIIEQSGSERVVVKISGKHFSEMRSWLPFVLRCYFYKESAAIKIIHTIIYDGDEKNDFIKALGLTFDVPLSETSYNRHIKFTDSSTDGVFSEAVQNLTGLRRDPGAEARRKQIKGETIFVTDMSNIISNELKYIPQWASYQLDQLSPKSYSIRKRTSSEHSWLASHYGEKAYGTGFLGESEKGISFGIRNFWQSFPAGIHIENASQNLAKLRLWLWSPTSESMDLRFYHDGLGEDSFEKQRDALDITYEDYEPGFGRPIGIARTSEIWLKAEDSVPSNEQLIAISKQFQNPLQLIAESNYLYQTSAFGHNWCPSNKNDIKKQQLQKQLDFYADFYLQEIQSRNWYGYWNYGDIMHSYDADRHNWRYDTGGFAWDNSELSSDLWLWYYFLQTGRKDVFRMAEAMTRHTGEVDVHHIGPFAPLGSRHNVMHWGDSSKQLRISTVTNRRFLYYLTADERIGDLMHEQVEAYKTLQKIAPGRKLPKGSLQQENTDSRLVNMGFGTDWGSVAAAWFTEWERTRNRKWLQLLENSMTTIASQPHGFFTGGGAMNIETGAFVKDNSGKITVSHLNAVFGLPEILTEINASIENPKFLQVWLEYCELYNAPALVQQQKLGQPLPKLNLQQGHARLTAYAAWVKKDKKLLQLAWKKFEEGNGGIKKTTTNTKELQPPEVVKTILESPNISTNAIAQWSLAAIQLLAYDF